jgi:hypothetical protein
MGNLTNVSVEFLQPLWSVGSVVVLGIVATSALFCLEQVARGRWQRIVAGTVLFGTNALRFRIAPVGMRE